MSRKREIKKKSLKNANHKLHYLAQEINMGDCLSSGAHKIEIKSSHLYDLKTMLFSTDLAPD